jgi:hypothetical protein
MSAMMRVDLYSDDDIRQLMGDLEAIDPGVSELLDKLCRTAMDNPARDDIFGEAYARCLRGLGRHPMVVDRAQRDKMGGVDAAFRLLVFFHLDPAQKAMWRKPQ